jgi:flagella basal body P-ring formation protein FlgA
MKIRSVFLTVALLATTGTAAFAQAPALAQGGDMIDSPVLRANVTVVGDLVRIGDLIDHAGSAAQIAVYRAPDLGTTGMLPTAQVLSALRAHQVIGVDTRNVSAVSVTRLARTLDARDLELQVARALEHKNGLGDAATLSLTFDRDVQDLRLEASNTGAMQPAAVRYDQRNGRFDITFEIANENAANPTRLRFTGSAVETVEAAVLARNVERNELIKSADVVVERRPKAEVGGDAATRDRTVGMQARRPLRSGQAVKTADLVKPDLVQRDQTVTLIYEATGLYLTIRGKALEGGAEGDVVSVLNLQSKRTVTGTVIARGQVAISVAMPRPAATGDVTSSLHQEPAAAPVALAAANASSAAEKAE